MKLLFDGNLSAVLVRHLDELYPGSTHVGRIGLERGSDQKVWDYAKTQGHIIATKDSDFQDLSALYGIRRKSCGYDAGIAARAMSPIFFGNTTRPWSRSRTTRTPRCSCSSE